MSTRSCIARVAGDGWEGRYHHSDGYPTGLGAELYRAYNGHFAQDAEAMLDFLIEQHPAGWSNILDSDYAVPAQWVGSYGRELQTSPWKYLTSQPICYCHTDGSRDPEEGESWIRSTDEANPESDSPLFIEWVYVISPSGLMTVLCHSKKAGAPSSYGWRYVAQVDLSGPEPDWEQIEAARG